MDWIILNLISNKRNNKLIYGFLFGIIILDFLNDQIGFINEKYLIIDFSLFAIGLLIVKEILNYWYRNLYRRNQKILDDIKEISRTGNYSKIIEQAELIKIIKPQLTEKTYWTGFANVYLNNPQKALHEFDSIELEYQNFSGFFYHKGLALIDSGNIEKSIEYLTRSIELEKTWQNLDQRGVAYMNINKLNEAEKDLRESIKLKVDSSNTCNLGVVLDKKGQHKEAIEFYNRSIDIKSENPNAFYNRALANYYLENYQESISDNTKTIELDSKRHWAYYNRALSSQKIKELESAIKDFDYTQKLGHEDKYLYLNRGFCKCEFGEISNGLIDLKQADKLDCKEAKELIEKYDSQ
ncbi:tetratricopeptide repeat protein [uncultured Sunxiuqinia sp.]|uniref:tetratricopeptide repeat protein n=1 Tax=uncultured Sunxiuqinia sp. TaxID=1573825 RepID=UPI002AA73DAD|nr:tetratricopeptide repeat protein [uncultured Sunxiuqinia sp.]